MCCCFFNYINNQKKKCNMEYLFSKQVICCVMQHFYMNETQDQHWLGRGFVIGSHKETGVTLFKYIATTKKKKTKNFCIICLLVQLSAILLQSVRFTYQNLEGLRCWSWAKQDQISPEEKKWLKCHVVSHYHTDWSAWGQLYVELWCSCCIFLNYQMYCSVVPMQTIV